MTELNSLGMQHQLHKYLPDDLHICKRFPKKKETENERQQKQKIIKENCEAPGWKMEKANSYTFLIDLHQSFYHRKRSIRQM